MIMFAEVRKDGQWHKVGKEFVSTYDEMEGQLTDRVFDGRNTHLTQLLKDNSVCNAYDLSYEIRNHALFKDAELYHCSLKDILRIDWNKEIYRTGYISEWQYKRLKNGVEPVHITSLVSDREIVKPFWMDMILENQSLRDESANYYVEYLYDKHTMRELCDFFVNTSIPGLVKLVPQGGTTDDVRIIFIV
jgi:hypothetical protein